MKLLQLILILGVSSWIGYAKPLRRNNTNFIIGGQNAEPNQFPYQVAIYRFNYFICGGSIIARSWVLTAAHCIGANKPNQYLILAGTNKNLLNSEGSKIFKVNYVTIHEDYIDGLFKYDVGLMHTKHKFHYDESVQPIPLATKAIPLDSEVIVSGWGIYEDGGEYPVDLKWSTFYKDDPDSCGFSVGFTEGLICLAHPEDYGICLGDSGGPATYENELVGVANFIVSDCGTIFSDGYLKVSHYINWIKASMEKYNDKTPIYM